VGPILYQLPPHWHFNATRLAHFFALLGDTFSYAFEFRDRSWLNAHTYELLAQHNAAFCIYELDGYLTPREITAAARLQGEGETGNRSRDWPGPCTTTWRR